MQKIASLLLKKNDIQFDKDEFSFQIQSHPSYPSLHAITGVLDHFNIDNVAARVPNTKESLELLPSNFIAQFQGDNIQGLFLIEKKNNSYRLFNSDRKTKLISINEFIEAFTGVILAVEKQENNIRNSTPKNLYTNIGFLIATISLLSVFVVASTSLLANAIFFISAIGILISVSILQQELGIKNSIGDAFCSSSSDKKDCNAVLNSKGANLFKTYKLSDVSLIYFVGYAISVFLLIIQGASLELIYLISLLGLPVVIYSIYYQAFIVKTWCFLCLSIVGVLLSQVIISLFFLSQSLYVEIELIEVLSISIGFFSIFSIWSFLKPKYAEAVENKSHKIESFKFKRNYNLFTTLLKKSRVVNTVIHTKDEIVFGNRKSKVEIVIVTNPFCGHCKPVHTLVEEVLEKHGKDVKITIRFNINLTDLDSDVFVICSHLLHIYSIYGEEKSLIAMHEAYDKLSPKDWINKWGDQKIDVEFYKGILEEQKEWCKSSHLNFTPAILINGYSYPQDYERKDLVLFIEELNEEYNE